MVFSHALVFGTAGQGTKAPPRILLAIAYS